MWDFTRKMAGPGGGTLPLSLKTNLFDAHFVFYLEVSLTGFPFGKAQKGVEGTGGC